MTDTTIAPSAEGARPAGGLSAMKLDELKGLATSLGITGTTRMRKSDLVEAISARRSGSSSPRPATTTTTTTTQPAIPATESATQPAAPAAQSDGEAVVGTGIARTRRRAASRPASAPSAQDGAPMAPRSADGGSGSADTSPLAAIERAVEAAEARRDDRGDRTMDRTTDRGDRTERTDRGDRTDRTDRRDDGYQRRDNRDTRDNRSSGGQSGSAGQSGQGNQTNQGGQGQGQGQRQQNPQGQQRQQQGGQGNQGNQGNRYDDDDRSGRRRSRQRSRDRKRGRVGPGQIVGADYDGDVQIAEDDVLVPVGGILDVLDNYAFVRTSGYLPGPNDVYLPLGMVKRYGLRKGDAVTGQVKAMAEGEGQQAGNSRQRFNALVRLDTVNGLSPDHARGRVEFNKLTPLYPQERLRLETAPNVLTTRIIDLVSPIGKGQRGLIVSPPKAGKTLILQAIANAISTNNPEVHLMVVLVDERPEEVTDMQRTVKGEVIASTFDRPADDHTTVAELAIERAKRLVELGHDVVVLLDSITRLGRAYNLAAPASGRILSGGVDSSALYPPKRFFGAARNIEDGGSLTILATALVETGSKMDEVIFEEFKGTGNMELRLSRQLADRRIFPAVDVNPSGTRREEILMGAEELKIMWKLRRVLSALDSQQSIELLIDRLKKTRSNVEFLMQVQKNSSIQVDDDD